MSDTNDDAATDHETSALEPPKKKRRIPILTLEDRRALFEALRSCMSFTIMSPKRKTLAHGSLGKVARQLEEERKLKIGTKRLKKFWDAFLSRIEDLMEKQDSDTTNLSYDERFDKIYQDHQEEILKPKPDNRKGNCGAKTKWDPKLLQKVIDEIPLAEQRSLTSIAKVLNLPKNTLIRMLDSKELTLKDDKETRLGIRFRDAKRQLEQLNKGQSQQEGEEEPNISAASTNPKQVIVDTSQLNDLLGTAAVCAHCKEGTLVLKFLTTMECTTTMSTANSNSGKQKGFSLTVPKMECQNPDCRFVGFAGNTSTKVISTPRYVGGPVGAHSKK